jgi:hypothetical protein
MQLAYYTNPKPKELAHGEWHMPYISQEDWAEVSTGDNKGASPLVQIEVLKKVSVARCARVSYLTHDGKRELTADFDLFTKLQASGHWSPFEHVATPATDGWTSGNFRGWRQYRKSFLHENRTDFIPNHPSLAHVQMEMEAGIPYKQGVRIR